MVFLPSARKKVISNHDIYVAELRKIASVGSESDDHRFFTYQGGIRTPFGQTADVAWILRLLFKL
jgi:hypothetical protein